MHLLNEKEYQDYSAYKKIEPQIKSCFDREREFKKQLEEKEEAIKYLKGIKRYDIGEMIKKNAQLKQQLANTETQNKRVLEKLELIVKDNQDLQKQLSEKEKQVIAFAKEIAVLNRNVEAYKTLAVDLFNSKNKKTIKELEKLKDLFIQNADEIGEEYREDYFMISLGNVKRIIDQRIKELEGEEL